MFRVELIIFKVAVIFDNKLDSELIFLKENMSIYKKEIKIAKTNPQSFTR